MLLFVAVSIIGKSTFCRLLHEINSSRPTDVQMRQWTKLSLGRVMAYNLFPPGHYLKQWLRVAYLSVFLPLVSLRRRRKNNIHVNGKICYPLLSTYVPKQTYTAVICGFISLWVCSSTFINANHVTIPGWFILSRFRDGGSDRLRDRFIRSLNTWSMLQVEDKYNLFNIIISVLLKRIGCIVFHILQTIDSFQIYTR